MRTIILGSSSPIRKQLFSRLQLPFEIMHPDIDETPLDQESPEALVNRLSRQKAEKIALQSPDSLVIACDQVIAVDNKILGKPGDYDNAVKQLLMSSGKKVTSLTGVCVGVGELDIWQQFLEYYYVYYRNLSRSTIDNYLKKDKPYACAGSIQAEKLGPALFSKMEGDDPTALLGLPLIRLTQVLGNFGVEVV